METPALCHQRAGRIAMLDGIAINLYQTGQKIKSQ